MKARDVWTFVLAATAASGLTAAELDVRLTSRAEPAVTVASEGTVDYEIRAQLTDTDNEGLALFALDLQFDGGELTPVATPDTLPMSAFARDDGLTNPAGFGGTVVEGALLQVGGGQNTVGNFEDPAHAPFPLGTVVTGVAHGPEILAYGTFVAPEEPGTYTLTVTAMVANVLRAGETGQGGSWATEAIGPGSLEPLTVRVIDCRGRPGARVCATSGPASP